MPTTSDRTAVLAIIEAGGLAEGQDRPFDHIYEYIDANTGKSCWWCVWNTGRDSTPAAADDLARNPFALYGMQVWSRSEPTTHSVGMVARVDHWREVVRHILMIKYGVRPDEVQAFMEVRESAEGIEYWFTHYAVESGEDYDDKRTNLIKEYVRWRIDYRRQTGYHVAEVAEDDR